jgi:hypothetical protein
MDINFRIFPQSKSPFPEYRDLKFVSKNSNSGICLWSVSRTGGHNGLHGHHPGFRHLPRFPELVSQPGPPLASPRNQLAVKDVTPSLRLPGLRQSHHDTRRCSAEVVVVTVVSPGMALPSSEAMNMKAAFFWRAPHVRPSLSRDKRLEAGGRSHQHSRLNHHCWLHGPCYL